VCVIHSYGGKNQNNGLFSGHVLVGNCMAYKLKLVQGSGLSIEEIEVGTAYLKYEWEHSLSKLLLYREPFKICYICAY
jgi:hypothetical protein